MHKFEPGKSYVGIQPSSYRLGSDLPPVRIACTRRTKCYITLQLDGYPPARIYKSPDHPGFEPGTGIEAVYPDYKYYWLPKIVEAKEWRMNDEQH
ncbi:MAG: hypothetical protein WCS18_05185 [Sphaerochaetaceae bacterium]